MTNRNDQSLILCATPRSGSYLLADLLKQCGLPFAEEYLTAFHQSARKRAYGVKECLPYLDYLRLLSGRERRDGRFAMKIMHPQFCQLMDFLGNAPAVPGESAYDRFCALFPNPRFIHITRADKLAQAISYLKARQTGEWVRRRGAQPGAAPEPVYSFLGICRALNDRRLADAHWQAFFEEHKVEVMPVVYEALTERRRDTLRSICAWLGAEPPDFGQTAEAFVRTASSVNRDWEERFARDQAACQPVDPQTRLPLLGQLQVAAATVSPACIVGARQPFEVEVANPGPADLQPHGCADGTAWLRVCVLLEGQGTEEQVEQELTRLPDGRFHVRALLPAPLVAGGYQLRVALAAGSLTADEIRQQARLTRTIEFRHPSPRAEARELLEGVVDLRNGWQYLDWFGYFLDDKFPWIYHSDHEWLYFKPGRQEGGVFHVLDANLGWLEVDPRSYPRVRSLDSGEPWTFCRREGGVRHFRREADQAPFTAQTNRPEHLRELSTE